MTAGRRCSVCAHAERTQVDARLAAGASLRDVAQEFIVTKSAVYRHLRNCRAQALLIYHQTRPAAQSDGLDQFAVHSTAANPRDFVTFIQGAVAAAPSEDEIVALASYTASHAAAAAIRSGNGPAMLRAADQLLRVETFRLNGIERRARLTSPDQQTLPGPLALLTEVLSQSFDDLRVGQEGGI